MSPRRWDDEEVLMGDGYPDLRRDHPGQAITPARKADKTRPPEVHYARERVTPAARRGLGTDRLVCRASGGADG